MKFSCRQKYLYHAGKGMCFVYEKFIFVSTLKFLLGQVPDNKPQSLLESSYNFAMFDFDKSQGTRKTDDWV